MNRSTPGLPVHHRLPEFTQTHVHRVSDDIQPSHPLSYILIIAVQLLSDLQLFVSHGWQHARLHRLSLYPSLWVCSNLCPLTWWWYQTISSSNTFISICLQSFPILGFFQWVGSFHQVAKVLEFQLQHQSFQWIFRFDFCWVLLIWLPYSPRDFEDSSLAPWFNSISPPVLSLLYDKTLLSTHYYWKNR